MITMFESGSLCLLYLLAIYFNSLDVFKPATSGVVEYDALHGSHGQLCYRLHQKEGVLWEQLGPKVGSLLLISS